MPADDDKLKMKKLKAENEELMIELRQLDKAPRPNQVSKDIIAFVKARCESNGGD